MHSLERIYRTTLETLRVRISAETYLALPIHELSQDNPRPRYQRIHDASLLAD